MGNAMTVSDAPSNVVQLRQNQTQQADQEGAELEQLINWFEESESLTYQSRLKMDRDVDYYDGKQWTEEQKRKIEARGQPALVINQIKPEIDYLSGVEKSQRVDPKAYPRTPEDEGAAYAATQGLRFVIDENNYDNVRSIAWKGLLKPGMAVVKVGVKETPNGRTPEIKAHNYDRFFFDAHSSELDFSDARFMGLVTWMDYSSAVSLYGEENKDKLVASMNSDGYSTHYDDKPKWAVWGDSKRKRVRMVEMYYKMDGVWHEAIYTKGGIIVNRVSPYLDEFGRPDCPIIAQSAYVDRDNNRYGQIREMIDPQSDYNKRRSKATHILNSRQVIADKGAVDDPNKARRELAQPDAFIEKNPNKEFNIQTNAGLEQGQFQLMQEAGNQIRSNSIKNAMIGGNDQSGRAKQSQQQAAMIEIGDLLDNLRHLDQRVFQAVWNRIKQFWDGPRWIRITDDPNNLQYLGLNIPQQDEFGNVVQMQNPVAEMNVDLRIEDAPDVTSLQTEAYEQWSTNLAPMLLQAGVPPLEVAKVSIELMPHNRGKEAAKRITEKLEEQAQQPPQIPPQVQLEMAEKEAQIMKIKAETQKIMQPDAPNVPANDGLDPRLQLEAQKAAADIDIKRRELALRGEIEADKLNNQIRLKEMELASQGVPPEVYSETAKQAVVDNNNSIVDAISQMAGMIAQLSQSQNAPKRVVRDEQGNIIGVEPVSLDAAE